MADALRVIGGVLLGYVILAAFIWIACHNDKDYHDPTDPNGPPC